MLDTRCIELHGFHRFPYRERKALTRPAPARPELTRYIFWPRQASARKPYQLDSLGFFYSSLCHVAAEKPNNLMAPLNQTAAHG